MLTKGRRKRVHPRTPLTYREREACEGMQRRGPDDHERWYGDRSEPQEENGGGEHSEGAVRTCQGAR